VYVNAVGAMGDLRFTGRSRSVDGGGAVLAEAASDAETLLVAPVGMSGADDDCVDYLRQLPQDLKVVRERVAD
jgi:hypothetical protein